MDDVLVVVFDFGVGDGAASLWVCWMESVRSDEYGNGSSHTSRERRVMWWEHVVGSANDLESCSV